MTTRVEMIIETLQAHPDRVFTAKELAVSMLARYPQEMAKKRPGYASEEELIRQLAAEIGGSRTEQAKARCPQVMTRDKPRPRLYFWESAAHLPEGNGQPSETENDAVSEPEAVGRYERDLYPLLIQFLSEDQGLFCRRINESTSRNSRGNGGNHWLHPDIVALEQLDKKWLGEVRDCVRNGGGSSVRLWSFEVKKQLTLSNVRSYFFQAVSNSSWANYGYLVITGLNNDVEKELQTLSGLHGIGVLLLNTDSLFDSQILIPARLRADVDWSSVNRIVEENADFKQYIEQVGIYLQTGKLVKAVWNK